MKIDRLVSIILLLLEKERVGAQQLADLFEVSPRTIYRDIDGQFYSAEELLEKVHAASRAPLYSNWAFLLGHGIVGGKLISGVRHGEMAARMAMQVLSGIRASSIPIVEQADQAFMFDNNELQVAYER